MQPSQLLTPSPISIFEKPQRFRLYGVPHVDPPKIHVKLGYLSIYRIRDVTRRWKIKMDKLPRASVTESTLVSNSSDLLSSMKLSVRFLRLHPRLHKVLAFCLFSLLFSYLLRDQLSCEKETNLPLFFDIDIEVTR